MCARAHSTVCIMERGDLKSDPPVISDILTPLGTSVFLLESPNLEEEEADFSLPSWAWGIADTTSLSWQGLPPPVRGMVKPEGLCPGE